MSRFTGSPVFWIAGRGLALTLAVALVGTAHAQKPSRKRTKPAAPSVRKTSARPVAGGPGIRAELPPSWSVAFSPDSTKLAVGGYRSVTIWSVGEGKQLSRWEVGADAVRTLAFSPDGALLAVGGGAPGADGALVLLDTRSGSVVRRIDAHDDTVEAVAFAGNHLISAGDDERVVITDVRTGAKVGTLTEHIGRCLSVAVPLRTSEGSGGAVFATGGADKMVKIWDADLRRVVVNFDQAAGPVWAIAPLPQPGRFAAAGGDGVVRIYQVAADRPGVVDDNNTPGGAQKPDSELEIKATVRTGEPAPRTGRLTANLAGHSGPVYSVAVSRNGNYIVSGGADRKVVVWNPGGGRIREHAEATSDIWNLAISPSSRWLATASRDGRVRLYDLADGTYVRQVPPPATGAKP